MTKVRPIKLHTSCIYIMHAKGGFDNFSIDLKFVPCILESTSFRSPSSGSGSSGIGSSSSSTSGGANNPNRVKTPRSHQDDSEESGVGHEEDEEMQQLLVELLSLIRTPKVIKTFLVQYEF